MPKFSTRSRNRLKTCHKDLQKVMNEVIKNYDIIILEGHRGKLAQNNAYAMGNSKVKWPDSRHNLKPSNAVDIGPYPLDFNDVQEFCYMAGVVMGVAAQLGIKLKWGGRFKDFFDGAHFELTK